jgi:hypothetical protein
MLFSVLIFRYVREKRYSENDFTRYQYAVVAISAWKEKPILGLGTGSSKSVMRDIDFVKSLGFEETSRFNDHPAITHPHNQFLNELLQFGIFGIVPLLWLVATIIQQSWKAQNYDFLLFGVVITLFMLIEAPFNSNKGVVPFALVTTLLAYRLKNFNSSQSRLA